MAPRSALRWWAVPVLLALIAVVALLWPRWTDPSTRYVVPAAELAQAQSSLASLAVKGRAPTTGYERELFGDGWAEGDDGCSTREAVLARDLTDLTLDGCTVLRGTLLDPYTGETIAFERGPDSADVQIDHVVALSDAWQKGAQQWPADRRIQFANDPLNLLAVDGAANQAKGAGDAATWLPPDRGYRCAYAIRQVGVKARYGLWVTAAEGEALRRELGRCVTVP
ncbi:HNH endonuclease family protein [Actinotalea sp.]|uniref:HNH endonuclease family protein n=1 Tax=Actinotalea sp. TaxID=1872145 RepID=UPI003566F1A1